MQTEWSILREAGSDWLKHKAPQAGAALAFYSILSLAPLLIIAVSLAGMVFDDAQGQLIKQAEGLVGKEGSEAVEEMLVHAKKPARGAMATMLGLATLLFGASGVFGQLQDAMNTIWEVKPKANAGFMSMIRARFLSFAMVLGTGFLLLVSLVLSAFIAGLGNYVGGRVPAWEPFLHIANIGVTFVVVTLLFAMIYKLLPDAKVAWRDVWFGALVTAFLFTVGKSLIGMYLGKSGLASAYGAAGSFVVLIVWNYYSAQILLFGAELTHAFAGQRQHAGRNLTADHKSGDLLTALPVARH